jgi:solute carrier family 25 2-oxodicarboxylate transporter 21
MHPLDLVKTRIQIQATKPNAAAAAVDPTHYNGIVDCMRKMYRTEGVTSFWKGIIPPILVETPKRAWKFFTFEQFKTLFKFTPDQNQALTFSLAGLGSGVTEAIIVNPFEVVKVRMQSNRAKGTAAPSTFAVAKEIAKADGWLRHGLLGKGITATMGRNGTFNMIYFGFYHTVREYLPVLENPRYMKRDLEY